MHYGLIITVTFIAGGILLVINNKGIGGYTTLIATFGFNAYSFFSQRKKTQQDKTSTGKVLKKKGKGSVN